MTEGAPGNLLRGWRVEVAFAGIKDNAETLSAQRFAEKQSEKKTGFPPSSGRVKATATFRNGERRAGSEKNTG